MTVESCQGSETWTFRKTEEDLLNVFQRNGRQIVLGTHLTDRISINNLGDKLGSIALSRTILREKMRRLGHISG